eukprot:Lithocolla_globosa_v1_NODE_2715_length_1895_cov_37.704891.p2 type:complete len:149 gc:universal NODE_2715_length_1895_cov_37.704891:1439-993(-)
MRFKSPQSPGPVSAITTLEGVQIIEKTIINNFIDGSMKEIIFVFTQENQVVISHLNLNGVHHVFFQIRSDCCCISRCGGTVQRVQRSVGGLALNGQVASHRGDSQGVGGRQEADQDIRTRLNIILRESEFRRKRNGVLMGVILGKVNH